MRFPQYNELLPTKKQKKRKKKRILIIILALHHPHLFYYNLFVNLKHSHLRKYPDKARGQWKNILTPVSAIEIKEVSII